jgi:succinate-semialdehyde dehydrogenase/glutarate-semialdehyde dehydrogenase
MLAMVHGPGTKVGQRLLENQDIAFYTFTGSTRVGKEIQRAAGLRGTQLELGSIASTILCHDADLDLAIGKFGNACFRKAGQVCTSVQRIFVDRRVYNEFKARFIPAVKALAVGDPRKPETVVGPMISEAQAERATSWVEKARIAGATVLIGGGREGAVMRPTVLENVKPDMQVVCQEIFAPCVSLIPFNTLDDALAQANATPFGLAVGIFTRDISTALRAAQRLDFGAVHINETSSSRVDQMPFGGVKDSGFGREGPRYAIREMLEERLITIAY